MGLHPNNFRVIDFFSNLPNDYQAGVLSVLSPDVIHAEMGNIVRKNHVFQWLTPDDTEIIVDQFRKRVITLTRWRTFSRNHIA